MNLDIEWSKQEKPSEVTVAELKTLCDSLYKMRGEIDILEDTVSLKKSEYKLTEAKVLEYLEQYGLSNFECELGKISVGKRFSVRQPATPEAKEAFFNYLRSKGDFENLVSVNSKTLGSYVRGEIETAEAKGEIGWIPPGLEAPERVPYLSLRKK